MCVLFYVCYGSLCHMNPFLPLSLLGAIMDECKGRNGVV